MKSRQCARRLLLCLLDKLSFRIAVLDLAEVQLLRGPPQSSGDRRPQRRSGDPATRYLPAAACAARRVDTGDPARRISSSSRVPSVVDEERREAACRLARTSRTGPAASSTRLSFPRESSSGLTGTSFIFRTSLNISVDRRCRRIRADAGGDEERTRLPAHRERGKCAVGISLVLAQVQVDPAGEEAAEDRVHRPRWLHSPASPARRPGHATRTCVCARPGRVHDDRASRSSRAAAGIACGRRRLSRPSAENVFVRHALRAPCARSRRPRPAPRSRAPIARSLNFEHGLACERLVRRLRAEFDVAVRDDAGPNSADAMTRAAVCPGLLFCADQVGEPARALPLDLLRRERRVRGPRLPSAASAAGNCARERRRPTPGCGPCSMR